MSTALCGGPGMDAYTGLPPLREPRCADGHREIYMRWRVRRNGYWCRHCGAVMSVEENMSRPDNAWYKRRLNAVYAWIFSEEVA